MYIVAPAVLSAWRDTFRKSLTKNKKARRGAGLS
jgi:hypothetical protein